MGFATADNPRVLAVEFDAGRRRELSERLGQWKLDFRIVAGGAAAIVALRTAARQLLPYHFAIIARDMPRMDGLTLIDAIHADARIRDTRLVLRGEEVDVQVAVNDYDGLLAVLRAHGGRSAQASPTGEDGDHPVFDLAAFGERLEHDEAVMRAVAEVFLDDVPRLLDRIRHCAADGDWRVCASLGHQIKGSAANIGGMALSVQARRVEEAGRNGEGERVVGALDELQRRFDALRGEMTVRLG